MLQDGIKWRVQMGDHDHRLDALAAFGSRAVASMSWRDEEGRRHRFAQALRVLDGKIVDLQDYASPQRALTLTRARAAFGV